MPYSGCASCLQVVGASSTPQLSQQQQQHAEQPGSSAPRPANGNGSSSSSSSSDGWPLYLQLSSGDEVGVDLLVQAIGVEPSTDWLPGELVLGVYMCCVHTQLTSPTHPNTSCNCPLMSKLCDVLTKARSLMAGSALPSP
jgi:hypothetical protein